jgi:DNA-binding beta-propeller fold protein YncE
MQPSKTPLSHLARALAALALATAACGAPAPSPGETPDAGTPADGMADAGTPPDPTPVRYETWALDQGTNKIHFIDDQLALTGVLDLGAYDVPDSDATIKVPHMIDFTSDDAWAVVASTGAPGHTTLIDARTREVRHVVETGPGSHMAAITPDDARVIVAVIQQGKLVELTLDRANGKLVPGRSLVIAEDLKFQERATEFKAAKPICHQYTKDGKYAYVTLGPTLAEAGLVILDVESFKLHKVFPPSEVEANCGTQLSPDGTRMWVNGGSADAKDAEGNVTAQGKGRWWVFDTATHAVVASGESRGKDAHGLIFTKGGAELWMVNRATSNAVVLDAATQQVSAELGEDVVGKSPDILALSPAGDRLFVTLRGPKPKSGPHAIAGTTPGVAVIDVATRKRLELIEPAKGNEDSDLHGIGVRRLP